MATKKPPPSPNKPLPPYHERGLNMLDVATTWLVVGHLGALGFLYNAVLSDQLEFNEPQRHLAGIFIFGAVSAFCAKLISAMHFINGEWPYGKAIVGLSIVISGAGLVIGLSGPLMYDWTH